MAVDSNTQAIIDAIKALKGEDTKELQKEIRNLSINIKTYIEKARSATSPEEAFKGLAKQLTSSIDEIIESQKENQSKVFEQYREKYADVEKQIAEKTDKIKGGVAPALEKELKKQVGDLNRQLKKISTDYNKLADKNNKELLKSIRENQEKLLEDLTAGFKELGEDVFKTELKTKDVDDALSKYKKALTDQYNDLVSNEKLRNKLGITEKQVGKIKEELYDSYFKELERQKDRADLDARTKKVLEDRIKREKIQAGRSTYEQTYGQGSAIAKLTGRLADFTTRRYKEQTEKTGAANKIFTSGLGALFKGKEAKAPFLDTGEETAFEINQKTVEGGEGRKYLPTFANMLKRMVGKGGAAKPTPQPTPQPAQQPAPQPTAEPVATTPEAESTVNPSASTEALEAIQQTFEEAKENVPFKVIVTEFDDIAKKGLTSSFNDAIRESLGAILKEGLEKTLKDTLKEMQVGQEKKKKEKKEEKDESFIDVEDIIDLLPKKKGFLKKTAQRGRIAAKKAGRGISRAAQGLSRVATGGVGIGGLLNTSVGSIGSLGAGAVVTSGALAAGTAYAGYKAGEALEENFGLGTKTLEAIGVNKETNELEKAQDELNGKLQDAAKIKDPNDRRIAYFEAQLENLEKQKLVQSGDDKANTEKMITVVKTKLDKLKNPPKIEAAKPTTASVTPSTTVTPAAAAPTTEAVKAVEGAATLPTITANIPQPKDVKPELDTNNKLTEQTNQKLDVLIKVMAGKDYSGTTIAPAIIAQPVPEQPAMGQTQSAAYQFRTQNRTV